MTNNSKTVGENKLDKLVRLMKRYEGEVSTQGEEVSVSIDSEGCSLLLVGRDIIYGGGVEKVVEFLEAGQLKRTLMVRG